MKYKRGQIVKISKISKEDDPRWLGLHGEVVDIQIYEYVAMTNQSPRTKIIPLSDRPDAYDPDKLDPRAEFFWNTEDLELVEDTDDGHCKATTT